MALWWGRGDLPIAALQPGGSCSYSGEASLIVLYVLAAFSGAALLFTLELMFTRMVLPVMGGTASVWTTCLLFYQFVLLAGYGYSHLLPRTLGLRRHALLHMALLVLSLFLLPIRLRLELGLPSAEQPVAWLLVLLTASIGLPFLLVSSTAPLLQRWLAATGRPESVDPYFLYAASNAGSFLGLLAYPTVLEPTLRLGTQASAWSVGYALLAVALALCSGWALRRPGADRTSPAVPPSPGPAVSPSRREWLRWIALALVPSSLLLGITTFLTTDIAAVPLLWVVPLLLYLLTFVLTFARRPLLSHSAMLRLQPILIVPLVIFLFWGPYLASPRLMPFHLAAFFVTAMVCHGELARTRPSADRLTEFYLCLALGGALGGAFNVLIAPVVFKTVQEYPLMLVLACALRPRSEPASAAAGRWLWLAALVAADALLVFLAIRFQSGYGFDLGPDAAAIVGTAVVSSLVAVLCYAARGRPLRLAGALGSVILAAALVRTLRPDILLEGRNFYGTHEVNQAGNGMRYLLHGTTIHGAQSTDPSRRREPSSYYSRQGPLGDVFQALPEGRDRRVGVIGLGAGGTAAYSRPGDSWVFYEIDPAIERIALDRRLFTYLDDAPARIQIRMGDGRLLMDREPEGFDLILLDAFSSDAIPIHLLTVEAMQMYLRKLAPEGIMVFHLSNRFLEVERVVGGLVQTLELEGRVRRDLRLTEARQRRGDTGSIWAVVARPGRMPAALAGAEGWEPLGADGRVTVWTDDYSSLVGLLRTR